MHLPEQPLEMGADALQASQTAFSTGCYGVFDAVANHCLVMVCLSAATAQFAVNSIRRWWELHGRERYAGCRRLLIECDGGGCNGYRPCLWKWLLRELADELGIRITVRHDPRGASKWNLIEHRVFGRISQNWAGYPLRTLNRILGFIRGTTTKSGLKIDAKYDSQTCEKGIAISDAQMKTLNITRDECCRRRRRIARGQCRVRLRRPVRRRRLHGHRILPRLRT